jgi:pimeloyl-ACP methyl ester carboxylesterase
MGSAYRSSSGADRVRGWCLAALRSWDEPHELHTIETSAGRTHVVSAGSGVPVCVYLPGTNFNAATSKPVLEALAARCTVYAADLPGQPGLSSPARPHDELTGYARWVRELIAWVRSRHGSERLVLIGHSRGAAVALSADPDTVDGLVLLSPAGLVDVRPSLAMLRATVPWLVRHNELESRRLLAYMSGPGQVPMDEQVEWMSLVARACRTTGAPGALPNADLVRWRGRGVVVAVGDHDVFFASQKLAMACRAELGVDLVVVRGAGHLLVDEEPGRVAELVIGSR